MMRDRDGSDGRFSRLQASRKFPMLVAGFVDLTLRSESQARELAQQDSKIRMRCRGSPYDNASQSAIQTIFCAVLDCLPIARRNWIISTLSRYAP